MEYVIPVVLVVVLVGGFVTFLVLNATNKRGPAAETGESTPGIGGDATPLGDTTQHAGEQTESGVTTSDPESPGGGGGTDPDAAAHVGRRGEGEAAERLEFEGERPRGGEDSSDQQPRPASERLADRDA